MSFLSNVRLERGENGVYRAHGKRVLPLPCQVCRAWRRNRVGFREPVRIKTSATDMVVVSRQVCSSCWYRHRILVVKAQERGETEILGPLRAADGTEILGPQSAADDPAQGARYRCTFCGKRVGEGSHGGAQDLTQLRDRYGRSHGYYCDSCEDLYDSFRSRLRYEHRRETPICLRPDPMTAQPVVIGPFPVRAVRWLIGRLESRIDEIPPAAARIAALTQGMYGAVDPIACHSREEACAMLSRLIAGEVGKHFASIREYGGKEYAVYTLSLIGDGAGFLLQESTTADDLIKQHCYLIDTDNSLHCYEHWER